MSRDARFLQEFIADFWDLLPSEQRELLWAYWHGLTMVVADLYQQTFETGLSFAIEDVRTFHTSRWERYQLNSETADLKSQSDDVTLTGVSPAALSKDAILFDTIEVSNASGKIVYTENVPLYDTDITQLKYDNIVADTLRVYNGGAVYRANVDYAANRLTGKIARIATGNIDDGEVVSVTYTHSTYTKDVDYTVDLLKREIARTASSTIPSSSTVSVSYTYDNSDADYMSGRGNVDATAQTFTDLDRDFSGVSQYRTLEILSGANAGTYTVHSIVSTNVIKIAETFAVNEDAVTYRINAFPYAITVDASIASVPTMQNLIVSPTLVYREDVDYLLGDGKISFRTVLPTTRENDGPTLWAEKTLVDHETVYRNFGVLIDFYRESSEDYLNAVKGIWYAYWTGSTHENLLRGLHILLGLPFAIEDGEVSSIDTEESVALDVSASADISYEPIRVIPGSATDAITAPDTVTFPDATGGYAFDSLDVGRYLRITGSSAGNDGYYEIVSVVSGQTVTVSPASLTTESAGFTGRLYESGAIDNFSYSGTAFSQADLGRTLRISGTALNDGDYTVQTVYSTSRIQVTPAFNALEGPGGGISALIIESTATNIAVVNSDGVVTEYAVPSLLDPLVSVGDNVERFQRLVEGVRLFSKNNDEDFIETYIGRVGIQRYLTQNATTGSGDTDETKALRLLREHVWLIEASTAAVSETTNVTECLTYLNNMKARWSDFIFAFFEDIEETVAFFEDLSPADFVLTIDLTLFIRAAAINTFQPGQEAYAGSGSIDRYTLRTPTTGIAIDAPSLFTATDGGFSSDDIGRIVYISGSGSGNNGSYAITHVFSSTQVQVSPDFTASESGVTAEIQSIIKLTDASATFTSDVVHGDILMIDTGPNVGYYRIDDVLSDTELIIYEIIYEGPFNETEVGRAFVVFSQQWSLDRGELHFSEHFLHERSDGAVTASDTFTVDASIDLQKLGVKAGFDLVIKSGANIDSYPITAVPTANTVQISGSFPTSPSSPEDYAICQASAVRKNAALTILEAAPI